MTTSGGENGNASCIQAKVLCFSATLIGPKAERQRAEAAMIYEHKPLCNVAYVHSFPYVISIT